MQSTHAHAPVEHEAESGVTMAVSVAAHQPVRGDTTQVQQVVYVSEVETKQ